MNRRSFIKGFGIAFSLAVSSPSLAWTQAQLRRDLLGFRAGEVHEVTFEGRWLDIPIYDPGVMVEFVSPASVQGFGAFTIENPFGQPAAASVFWPDEGGSPELVGIRRA
jgi:hypothetical protein